jgi:beta-barrel assembly-enhancing protease
MGRVLAVALALLTTPAQATPRASAFETLREQDQRVADIAWRLAVRGVPHCPGKIVPLTGIRPHAIGQYGARDRDAAIAHFGLGVRPAVLVVAKGSAAARAEIMRDDAIASIGVRLFDNAGEGYAMVAAVQAALAQTFDTGRAEVVLERKGKPIRITLYTDSGCQSEVELIPSAKRNASADGYYVQLSTGVVAETQDDDELAFVIAHEMAHNILRHPAWLKEIGRSARNIRDTEEQADTLAIKLMIAAGFDPHAAARFWARFGRKTGAGIFSDGTHLRTRARVELLEQLATQYTAQ